LPAFVLGGAAVFQPHQPREGRVTQFAAVGKLLRVKRGKIVLRGSLNDIIFRLVGLHNNAPAQGAAPRAAADLREDLKTAFRRAKVREVQSSFRQDDAHQRH